MPLWGCDCPLPARAALACLSLAGYGPARSQLALLSPLFFERAWQCLRLGLAFPVVVIPQSGLLAQVSSLRLGLGHSGQILMQSNAACASLPSPCLLMSGTGVCAGSPLRELPLAL